MRSCLSLQRNSAVEFRALPPDCCRTCARQACYQYVRGLPGVRIDARYITTAGISMGGAMAAALATTYSAFTTGMVLHSKCVSTALEMGKTIHWSQARAVRWSSIPSAQHPLHSVSFPRSHQNFVPHRPSAASGRRVMLTMCVTCSLALCKHLLRCRCRFLVRQLGPRNTPLWLSTGTFDKDSPVYADVKLFKLLAKVRARPPLCSCLRLRSHR